MVAMGFTQVEGVDYDETFASVMTTKTFRILLAIWNLNPELRFEHWDVKTAFVNAPLKETVYCRQVPGFERPGVEDKILLLKKALYGTKQAANAWQSFRKYYERVAAAVILRMSASTYSEETKELSSSLPHMWMIYSHCTTAPGSTSKQKF